MTTILQRLHDESGDPFYFAIKEWQNATGRIGVYQSLKHGYIVLALLNHDDGPLVTQDCTRQFLTITVKFAEQIAVLAGAKEITEREN